jgi:heme exporter protein A
MFAHVTENMPAILFQGSNLKKVFNRNTIFSDIHIELRETQSLAITGRNGSGKTTLLKILAGVSSATKGSVEFSLGGSPIDPIDWFRFLGFVSPYLQLYDEFTAWENLDLARRIRAIHAENSRLQTLLERVGLSQRNDNPVRTFSSGMKQRLKYACALLHDPPVLLLDEPTANLDVDGKSMVQAIIKEQRQQGVVVIATNEPDEVTWSGSILNLDNRPPIR